MRGPVAEKDKSPPGLSRLLNDLLNEVQEGLAKRMSQVGESGCGTRHQMLRCGPTEIHNLPHGISSCCIS